MADSIPFDYMTTAPRYDEQGNVSDAATGRPLDMGADFGLDSFRGAQANTLGISKDQYIGNEAAYRAQGTAAGNVDSRNALDKFMGYAIPGAVGAMFAGGLGAAYGGAGAAAAEGATGSAGFDPSLWDVGNIGGVGNAPGITAEGASFQPAGWDVTTAEDMRAGLAMQQGAGAPVLTDPATGMVIPGSGGGAPGQDPNDPNAGMSPGGSGSGVNFIDATTPTPALSPETMQLLGISPQSGGFESGFSMPEFGGTGGGFMPGGGDGGMGSMGGGSSGGNMSPDGSGDSDYLTKAQQLLKKFGLSPTTAAMLGISGINALSTPKLPAAAKSLSDQAGPGAQQAQAVIQSGGQSSPAWQAQKASIDAGIQQQIQEQTQAILQQAQNSGMGVDSNVTVQQINKAKTQLETQRQALYAQAQGQNVQAALQSLGIQDQALAQVANAQFKGSEEARASAAATAQNAMMLQALSKQVTANAP